MGFALGVSGFEVCHFGSSRRVLVTFRIEHWFACVRHTSCDFLLCSPFCLRFLQVMSQPRRSARLAALGRLLRYPSRSTSLTPMPFRTTCQRILLLFSDDVPFHPPLPASSVTGTSPLLGLSLTASCSAAPFPSTCSASPTWCTCFLNLWPVLPATHIPPRPSTSSTFNTSVAFTTWRPCRRVHDLFSSSMDGFFPQGALLLSAHSLRRPPLNTSFPLISTPSLQILHSIPSVSLTTCPISLPCSPSVVPTFVVLLISNP